MDFKLFALQGNERFYALGAILFITLVIRVSQMLTFKSQADLTSGAQRDYGLAGGAVCPKCKRPIQLSLFDIKFGFGTKFTRCVFCGKWSLVHRATPDELRAAELAELTSINNPPLP